MKKRQTTTRIAGVARKNNRVAGDGLTAAARAILADGRGALGNRQLADHEAVHELRKVLKRWRALLRLLEEPLGEEAKELRLQARELMWSLAGARDPQSALDALNDLRKGNKPLAPAATARIRARLVTMRDACETESFTDGARRNLGRYFDFAALSVERRPLRRLGFGTIADRLMTTYRRGRRLVPDDWASADPAQLHELRQRAIEIRHQIDLLEPLWPSLGKAWANNMLRLRNQLGASQDLVVLSRFTAPHQPLAPWHSQLEPLIEARRAKHLKVAARLAGRLFAEKPKAFRRRIKTLWSLRHTPGT